MKRALCTLLVLFALPLHGQSSRSSDAAPNRQTIQKILGFESEDGKTLPAGWGGGPKETIHADNQIVHTGLWSARLERTVTSTGTFSTLTAAVPQDFAGSQIVLKGFLRLKDVSDFAGLWMREDGDGKGLEFTNMQTQNVHGTADWKEYSIKLPLNPAATTLYIGVLMSGTGVLWADDLQLLVDGVPIAQAAERPKSAPTILDSDHEFDHGSGITMGPLTPIQIANLATLGRVWGFLKYHHTQVTAGKHQWDYELFRILPRVLASQSGSEADLALIHWIDSLGELAPCSSCAHLDLNTAEVKPDLGWIEGQGKLSEALTRRLQNVYANRPVGPQFYVSLGESVRNPSFDHELSYSAIKFPDAGFQLLALFRFWNIMQYWSPYRIDADEDWPQVLAEFIPKVALAKDKDAYQLAMMELIAKAHDTHANLWSGIELRPPVGQCSLPVETRFVEDRAVVTRYAAKGAEESSTLKIGDIIESLDGVAVKDLVEKWTPLYADSNTAARLRDIARHLTMGDCGPAEVRVRRGDQLLQLTPERVPMAAMSFPMTHDLPGDTFQLLSKDVAYLKLSSVKAADMPHDVELAQGTKGLIVDIRNYPSEFVVFALGSLLATGHTPFATFTNGDLSNPGAFRAGYTAALKPATPHYAGKVVILVDEDSQSQAEYTAMALRSTPNAIVIGSMTAGADGNVSEIALPGGLSTMISGLGVYYPDKRPTQRVGIRPDVEVKPTLAGIRAGRDEVLEAAIRQILGTGLSNER